MKWLIGLLMIVILLLVGVVVAQEDEPAACDYATIGERLVEAGESLADSANPAEALRELQGEIAQFSAGCSGFVFSSEEYGRSVVLDIMEFPDGFYRVTLDSTSANVDVTEVEGDCGDTFFYTNDGRVQTAGEMAGCVALIAIDADADWTLSYEKLR